jgi:hypothetical protein
MVWVMMNGCARQTYEGQPYDSLYAGHGGLRGWELDAGFIYENCPYATRYALGFLEDSKPVI